MTLLADALQPSIIGELASIRGRPNAVTVADVIITPTVGYDLNFDPRDRSIFLDFRAADVIASALAADCMRLSGAAFQTVASVSQEISNRDTVAWSLVKLYYSAFYAGHTLIRLFGQSCSYFDRRHVLQLHVLAAALGRIPPFSIDGGLYHCSAVNRGTVLKCLKVQGAFGGTHESFWRVFGVNIGTIANSILSGPLPQADAQAAFAQLDDMRIILGRATSHGWLSSIRNELQYRHGLGVWFPAQMNMRDRRIVGGIIRKWNQDPMIIDLRAGRLDTIGDFVSCCTFIVSLCHAMLERVAERSGASSFVRLGPMAFLNDIKARASA